MPKLSTILKFTYATATCAFLASSLVHCASEGPDSPAADEEAPTSSTSDELSAPLAERIIPLHLMSIRFGSSYVTDAQAQATIDVANRTFRSAGIQFVMGRNDYAYMPNIDTYYNTPTKLLCWNADTTCSPGCAPADNVMIEFTRAFGLTTAQQASVPKCESHTASDWAGKAAIQFAPKGEIFVWVQNKVNYSTFPDQGRSMSVSSGYFDSSNYLAHELGHYFGLSHSNGPSFDARLGAWAPMTDFWDMIYLPGYGTSAPVAPPGCAGAAGAGGSGASPIQKHKFFTSKAEAESFANSTNALGQGLQWIERCTDGACPTGPTCLLEGCAPSYNEGRITCNVGVGTPGAYSEPFTSSNPKELRGRMLFQSAGIASPPTSSVYGANLMSYTNNSLTQRANGLTESQIMIVRSALRYDVPINATEAARLKLPAGVTGGRPRLGGTQTTKPLQKIDLDGDGLRDLVFWYPATRQFKVIFSKRIGTNPPVYGTMPAQVLTLTVGTGSTPPGVPFAGDLDGDGRTDLGVVSNGVWSYCLTNASPLATTCATPSTITLGGGAAKVIGVHRMSNTSAAESVVTLSPSGVWAWKNAAGVAGTASLIPAGESTWGEAQALPGLYDDDDATDLVVYRASAATFTSFRSADNWSTPQHRYFSSYWHAPAVTGSASARAGGVPVPGMTWRKSGGGERQSLALWEPELGAWEVQFDPFGVPQKIEGAVYGVAGDIPIGGLDLGAASWGNYRFSSLSVYRSGALALQQPTLTYGRGYLFHQFVGDVATSHVGTLPSPGSYMKSDQGVASAQLPVFSVSDMTGDGLADVVRLDPLTNAVTIFASPYFTVPRVVSIGDGAGELL